MSNFTITFLNKEYSIPNDVMTYIRLIEVVDEVRDCLISSFCQQIATDVCNLEKSDFMVEEINNQISKFITLLLEHDIYDKTITDYLHDSKGYDLFHSTNEKIIKQILSIRKDKLDFYKAGVQEALYRKETSVTGLGFGIISNSFIDHMVYAHMNSSELEKQEKAAIKAYNQEIAELKNSAKSYDEQEREYISKHVIPAMNTLFTGFSYELLGKYISDLISAGRFDKSALSYVNIERSNDLLKNLEIATNKQAVIESAFVVCPYNIDVYMCAMEYGILDYTSFQTAKFFGHEDTLLSCLKENMTDPTGNEIHFNLDKLKQLALYTDTSLRDVTTYAADFVVKSYSKIIKLLKNPKRCKAFFNEATEDEITKDDHISKEKAEWIVESVAFTNLWDRLIYECNHDDLQKRVLILFDEQVDFNSKTEIDLHLKEKLYQVFEEIRYEIAKDIENKEASRLKYEQTFRARIDNFWNNNQDAIILAAIATVLILGLTFWSISNYKSKGAKIENTYSNEISIF